MTLSDRIVASKDLAEALSYWATALGIVVAIVAGLLAVARSYFEYREARWSRARDLYNNYLLMSIDRYHFYCDFWNDETKSRAERESYIGYMHYLLTAIEDIVTIDRRPEWRVSLLSDLRPHKAFLSSPEFERERDCYFSEVRELIDIIVSEPVSVNNA
jgi:hypothetical protein